MADNLADQMWETIGVLDRNNVQFLCIGTMLIAGDAIAPIVGSMLDELGYDVVGTEDYTLNAMNLLDRSEEDFRNDKILVAIDATIVTRNVKRPEKFPLGVPYIKTGGLAPGAGVGKSLGKFGDYALHVPMLHLVDVEGSTFDALREIDIDWVRDVADHIVDEIDLYFSWCDTAFTGVVFSDDSLEV